MLVYLQVLARAECREGYLAVPNLGGRRSYGQGVASGGTRKEEKRTRRGGLGEEEVEGQESDDRLPPLLGSMTVPP